MITWAAIFVVTTFIIGGLVFATPPQFRSPQQHSNPLVFATPPSDRRSGCDPDAEELTAIHNHVITLKGNDMRNKIAIGFISAAALRGFGALEVLNEDRLSPGAGVSRHRHNDSEIVTYVREGALAYEDSMGRLGVIHAGEFRCMTAGSGIRHSARNASRTDWAHIFQIWLRPAGSTWFMNYRRDETRGCTSCRVR